MFIINNDKCELANVILQNVDGDIVAFNEENNHIMVLNETASIIWDILAQADAKKSTVAFPSLLEHLQTIYDIDASMENEVLDDIKNIVMTLFETGYIKNRNE